MKLLGDAAELLLSCALPLFLGIVRHDSLARQDLLGEGVVSNVAGEFAIRKRTGGALLIGMLQGATYLPVSMFQLRDVILCTCGPHKGVYMGVTDEMRCRAHKSIVLWEIASAYGTTHLERLVAIRCNSEAMYCCDAVQLCGT